MTGRAARERGPRPRDPGHTKGAVDRATPGHTKAALGHATPGHTKGAVDHGALRTFFGCQSRSELQKPEGRVPAFAAAVSRGDSAKRGQPPS
jgi:hypothetical protein